jgi:hypothetical protein
MEQCDVCQSLGKLIFKYKFVLLFWEFLARKPTLPTDIGVIEDANVDKGFFEHLGDEIKRYGAYLRDKFLEIVERIRNKFKQIG